MKRIDGREDPPPPPSGPGEGFGAPKEGKKRAKGDFRGVKLSNETQPDPEALLARKSNAHPAQLSYRGHELMDNRHDLIVDCRVTRATDSGERDAAKEMTADLSGDHQKTIGTDKNNVSAVFGLHVIAYNLIRLGETALGAAFSAGVARDGGGKNSLLH